LLQNVNILSYHSGPLTSLDDAEIELFRTVRATNYISVLPTRTDCARI
jgi:hypothetical protein